MTDTKTETPVSETPKSETPKDEREASIIRQVEFYFSDSNLPRDKFLKGLTEADDGWVPIATIASFKRMRQLDAKLEEVVTALKKSVDLKVSDDGIKVRRTKALPADVNMICFKRTIYAKGFPEDATLESVTEYFKSQGDTICVRLRRTKAPEKKFKGSVFVEMASEDEAKRVAGLELKLPGKEEKLLILTKDAYVAKKKEEQSAKKKEGGGKGKKRKDGEDGQKGKKEKKQKQKGEGKEGEGESKGETKEGEEKKEEKEVEEFRYKKNLLIKISGLGDQTSRESIKEFLTAMSASIGYIDYQRGKDTAFVRLNEEDEAGASGIVAKAKESTIELGGKPGKDSTWAALEGEEEENYWKELAKKKKGGQGKKGGKKGKKNKGDKGGDGGKGKKGKKGGKGGKGGEWTGKRQKLDE